MAKQLEIELVRSVIANPQWMRVVVKTMGLRKLHSKVVRPDSPAVRGMIKKVPHLLKVREIEDGV